MSGSKKSKAIIPYYGCFLIDNCCHSYYYNIIVIILVVDIMMINNYINHVGNIEKH